MIANYLLIPKLGAMGAVIGTLIAELIACLWQFASIRKLISLKSTLSKCLVYFLFGQLMFAGVRAVALLNINVYVKVCIEVVAGVLIYLLACESYWRITRNNIRKILLKR